MIDAYSSSFESEAPPEELIGRRSFAEVKPRAWLREDDPAAVAPCAGSSPA